MLAVLWMKMQRSQLLGMDAVLWVEEGRTSQHPGMLAVLWMKMRMSQLLGMVAVLWVEEGRMSHRAMQLEMEVVLLASVALQLLWRQHCCRLQSLHPACVGHAMQKDVAVP